VGWGIPSPFNVVSVGGGGRRSRRLRFVAAQRLRSVGDGEGRIGGADRVTTLLLMESATTRKIQVRGSQVRRLATNETIIVILRLPRERASPAGDFTAQFRKGSTAALDERDWIIHGIIGGSLSLRNVLAPNAKYAREYFVPARIPFLSLSLSLSLSFLFFCYSSCFFLSRKSEEWGIVCGFGLLVPRLFPFFLHFSASRNAASVLFAISRGT